jgi:hypothetical protein
MVAFFFFLFFFCFCLVVCFCATKNENVIPFPLILLFYVDHDDLFLQVKNMLSFIRGLISHSAITEMYVFLEGVIKWSYYSILLPSHRFIAHFAACCVFAYKHLLSLFC